MLNLTAKRITALLLPEAIGNIDEQERDLCEYGCELCLYTIISTTGLILLGMLWGDLPGTVTMIAVFYLLQSFGGGYHASSHIKCFSLMGVALIIGIGLLRCRLSLLCLAILSSISVSFLFLFPLILHPNKQHLAIEQDRLRKKSRLITAVILVITIILIFSGLDHIFQASCIAVFFSAISRLSGLWIYSRCQ